MTNVKYLTTMCKIKVNGSIEGGKIIVNMYNSLSPFVLVCIHWLNPQNKNNLIVLEIYFELC